MMGKSAPEKYPFISDEELAEYRESGLPEAKILSISEKRQRDAAELKYEEYPNLTKAEFDQLVSQGVTRSKLGAINKQQGESLAKFLSNVTLDPSSYDIAKGSVTKGNLHLALVGLSGEGLSATRDTILGKGFATGSRKQDVTVSKISLSDENITDMSRREIDGVLKGGVDAFVLVVNISNHRDLKTQAKLWKNIKDSFGNEFVGRCVLVLTHADVAFKGEGSLVDLYRSYTDVGQNVPFGDVMRDLHPRIVALNNLTDNEREARLQRDIVLSMIGKMSSPKRPPTRPPEPDHHRPSPRQPEQNHPKANKQQGTQQKTEKSWWQRCTIV